MLTKSPPRECTSARQRRPECTEDSTAQQLDEVAAPPERSANSPSSEVVENEQNVDEVTALSDEEVLEDPPVADAEVHEDAATHPHVEVESPPTAQVPKEQPQVEARTHGAAAQPPAEQSSSSSSTAASSSAQQQPPEEPPQTHAARLLPPEPLPETTEKAKWQVLRALRVLKPLDLTTRREGYRLLCRRYHPDKNKELVSVALAAFQYLQKGKAALFLDDAV